MAGGGFHNQFPVGSGRPVDSDDAPDAGVPKFGVVRPNQEQPGHLPRGRGREMGVIIAALVHHKRQHAVRSPAGKFVIKLATCRMSPKHERPGRHFRTPGLVGKLPHGSEQRRAAARSGPAILFDVHVRMRVVFEKTAPECQLLAPGKILPNWFPNHVPAVPI